MRLIVATPRLVEPAGSETYALTVAEHLARLGHEVVLYGRAIGDPVAAWARARAPAITAELDELPETVDAVLIAADRALAFELADRHAEAVHVYTPHSEEDRYLPPPVPGVAATVALSDRQAQRAAASERSRPEASPSQPAGPATTLGESEPIWTPTPLILARSATSWLGPITTRAHASELIALIERLRPAARPARVDPSALPTLILLSEAQLRAEGVADVSRQEVRRWADEHARLFQTLVTARAARQAERDAARQAASAAEARLAAVTETLRWRLVCALMRPFDRLRR